MPAAIWPIELEEGAAFSLPIFRKVGGQIVSVADFDAEFKIWNEDGTLLYSGSVSDGVIVMEPPDATDTPVTGLISIYLTKQQVDNPSQAWERGHYALTIWLASDPTKQDTIKLLEGPARWDPLTT